MKRLFSTSIVAVLVLAGSASSAWAHKVIASGYAAGDKIEGEVGFSNGDPAINTTISITAPDGRTLGEVQTNAEGLFTFTPTEAVPHIFRGDLGAGHVAEFRMEVSELPRALQGGTAGAAPAPAASTASGPAVTASPDAAALQAMIAQAVRDEMRPLKHEIAAYKEHNSLQTILGGIGYILGLVGISFYWLAHQRLKKQPPQ